MAVDLKPVLPAAPTVPVRRVEERDEPPAQPRRGRKRDDDPAEEAARDDGHIDTYA